MRAIRKLALVLALFLIGGDGARARYWPNPTDRLLRYRFHAGDRLSYSIEETTTTKMKFADGRVESTKTEQVIDLTQTITEVKGESAGVRFKFERVRLRVDEGPTGKADFDSAAGKEAPPWIVHMAGPFARNVGKLEVIGSMDAQGRLSDLRVPLFAKMPNLRPRPGDAFSEESIRFMLGRSILVLAAPSPTPDKPWKHQAVGRTASGLIQVDEVMTPIGFARYTGLKVEQLAVRSSWKMKVSLAGLDITKSSGEGTAYFDKVTGRLVEQTSTLDLELATRGGPSIQARIEQRVTLQSR